MEEELAVPLLIPDTEFNLNKDSFNKKYLKEFLSKKPKVISNFKGHDIYHYGSDYNGAYFVYDPDEGVIIYFMRYEGKKRVMLNGLAVTQTTVWRGGTGTSISGLTHYVVFGVLLNKYPAIVSDKEQTENGKRLWFDLMTAALKLKLRTGIVDLNDGSLREAQHQAELRLWSVGELDSAWIETDNFQDKQKAKALRFFIARKH